VRNLMLKEDIVEAVKKGDFSIWAVETIEQAIEIMTGKPAGKLQPDGKYPQGTVFHQVDMALEKMAEIAKSFEKIEEK